MLMRESQKAHETLRQYQEQKSAYRIQGQVVSETNKVYKKFSDLTE